MFQSGAFQSGAFQFSAFNPIVTAVPTRPDKEAYSYHPKQITKEISKESLYEQRAQLEYVENQLLEKARLKELAHSRAIAKLAAEKTVLKQARLEKKLQQEISALAMERVRLMRMIDDNEAIVVLLLSFPLH